MPPQVRTLDQLMADSNAIYDPMRQNYQNMIAQSGNRLVEQEKGLGAAQQNAFGQINQAATNRGMLFSGFSPDQQAKYTAEKYLPALAGLRSANEENVGKISQSIMGLDSEQRKGANDTREGDLSRLFDWNKQQEQRTWEAEQARVAYDREMEKMRQEQKFTAGQNAAGRAAQPSNKENFAATLASAAGRDGKVSPGDYNALKQQWVASGYGDYKSFHDQFWRFANDSHWWDYR